MTTVPWRSMLRRPTVSNELRRASLATAVCGLIYALYRGYYGVGGTIGMIGTPSSWSEWRAQNLGAAIVLLAVALLPLVGLVLWQRPRWRAFLLAAAWALAVGGVMHAAIMDTQRVLSLTGLHRIHYPEAHWLSHRDHAADLQDLCFNETWFLVEGVLWGILAWIALGRGGATARRWLTSALAAAAMLTAVGLLSAFGVIGSVIVG